MGYYAQHQVDALDINATIYDEVISMVAPSQIPHIRNVLGLFGLRGENIYKKISVLSGGEKARVSLSKILLSPVNFLIMDEPTNHLDIASREALEHALVKYDGTLVLISHDRYFLDKIVHKVIELKDGHLAEYEGDYTTYLNKKKESPAAITDRMPNVPSGAKKSKDEKRKQAEARQAISKKRNDLLKSIETFELLVDELEQHKSKMELLMADPASYKSNESAASLAREYHQINLDIENNLNAWGAAQEELEKLLKEIE